MKKTLITAALPYANGPVHIGHIAGVYLPADIYARYMRNIGADVLFVSGTDEHGVPITIKAEKEGKNPIDVVDENYEIIAKSFWELGISVDVFSRTTKPIHFETATDFFKDLNTNGVFKEMVSEQYFDIVANKFLADRYIVGTCPKCANANAYGDQCENCGTTLSSTELINPKSALSGETPILKETKNWYLPLNELQTSFLEPWINSKTYWKANVLGQCKSWLNDGLKPRAMTRDLNWGVPVPIPNTDGKVMYVWFEAPIGYISATREVRPNDWEQWWKGDNTNLVHFIGKDNIVFHCIIFPAMLHAHSENYVLPTHIPANEFLNLEGNKISTSRNWAVWLHEYLLNFNGKADELRYVLCSIMPENKDSEFTWNDFQSRVNNELVAIFGNFINRTTVLTHKYYNGIIPLETTELVNEIKEIKQLVETELKKIANFLEAFKFRDALSSFMQIARIGNKFLADNEPWKQIKENPLAAQACIKTSLDIAHVLAIAVEPFMPHVHEKMCEQLQFIPIELELRSFWTNYTCWDFCKSGTKISEPSLLFSKIEDEQIQTEIEKLKPTNTFKVKDLIQYEDFSKLQIVVATIVTAEKVENADKLLQLTLDVNGTSKTVVSGIALYFKATDIIGKQVCYLANLAPRKMRGIVSEGMILMAENEDGTLVFVSPENAVNTGSVVA